MSSLAEKVREALSVPDMSYLKQDSFDKSEVCIFHSIFLTQTTISNTVFNPCRALAMIFRKIVGPIRHVV